MSTSWRVSNSTIQLVQGDITLQAVDAIVNAANSRLAGGGGVDGAIHLRGGPAIMEETRRCYRQGCATGSAVISGAGLLQCKYVIHAVGPVWQGGNRDEPHLLAGAYRTSLQLARDQQCQSIAFPALSCGAFGFPVAHAAEISLTVACDWAQANGLPAMIRFVLFGSSDFDSYQQSARQLLE